MKKKPFLQIALLFGLIVLLSLPEKSFSQQWGLYTLYATKNGTKAYLIDTANTPTTYHQWTFSSAARSAYSAYLIPGDTLVRTYKPSGNTWSAGAITGGIQKVTWDGTVAWDFTYYSSSYSAHHDICPMPNGNVLIISYDVRSAAQATQAGSSSANTFWSEKIIEVKPTGPTTGTIVWEWYLWDHMCQNHNSAKDNYVTSIVNNPQLLNINYSGSGALPDRYHMNGLDYNEELDQIAISMHYMNSVFVIDHSTTTAEASGHTGGNSGMGGDFLYRWGNPASWNASGSTVFNVIHDAHWIPADNPNYPNYLCGYNNNGGTGGKTAITIFDPPYSGYNYTVTPGHENPTSADYQFTTVFSANNEGNSQQLPNGNMLINNFQGSIYEVNSAGTQLWTKTSAQSTHAYRYSKCYVRGPKASATISLDNVCAGVQIALNSSAVSVTETNPTYSYNWTSTETGFTSTSQNPTDNPASSTTYIVTITNTAIGCSDTAEVSVIVIPGPTASVSTTNANCGTADGSATATATGGSGNYTYLWGANAGNQTTQTAINLTAGTYSVTVNDGNCSTIATGIVIEIGTPTVIVSPSNEVICQGQSVTLTATGADSYTWTPATGLNTTTGDVVIASPTSTITYTVEGTIPGCSNTADATIIVNPLPTTSVSATNASCGSADGTATVFPSGGSGSYTYLWDANAGNQTTQTATNLGAGSYNVTVSDGDCSTIATAIVNEDGAPVIVISQSSDNICEGQSVTLIATGADSYTWTPATGLNTTIGDTVIATPASTITYTCQGSTAGCSAFENVSIIVNPAAIADFSYIENDLTVDFTNLSMNALTYNWDFGDGNTTNIINPSHTYANSGNYNVELTATNDCSSDTITIMVDIITGISQIDGGSNQWSIYPNPTSGMIRFGNSPVHKVILSNSLRTVLETDYNVDKMDLSGYPSGIYYISIISENGSVSNHKVIVLK